MQVTFDSAAAPSQVITDRFGGMIAKYYKVDAALVDMSMRGEPASSNQAAATAPHPLCLPYVPCRLPPVMLPCLPLLPPQLGAEAQYCLRGGALGSWDPIAHQSVAHLVAHSALLALRLPQGAASRPTGS